MKGRNGEGKEENEEKEGRRRTEEENVSHRSVRDEKKRLTCVA